MIEVKNLCKTYNVKGNITKALDNVTIKFPETGMVFLLGKSGSGKSTLLNVCGGLDKADSGEIIIMGRSSQTFSKADFDSYRNTYVGFVFQEYNILNEFSIEDNLALALELQGKKKDKEKVKELLEQVDLVGFAKRKPNTLSGGQKQRIAIARALIKDPKIIMADEPTGALDSKTGKQVFDTLKKLSKDRLVIVVSHDREFSEIYGDRIIELKDGQILSDETKEKIESEKLNDNISLVSDNTLSIVDSKNLTKDDINKIVEFINNSNGELIISNGKDDIKSFKNVNHIDDENKTEKFLATNPENIKTKDYKKDDTKFIKSKLPMSKAAKMGISSLKVKPFRLVLTMLLTVISFILFGVASSLMNFNKDKVIQNSFRESDYEDIMISNEYTILQKYYSDNKLQYEYNSTNDTVYTNKNINDFKNKYGNDVLPVFALTSYSQEKITVTNITASQSTPKSLTDSSITGFAKAYDNSKYKNKLTGTYPVNDDEIAISSYYANLIIHSNYKDPKTSADKTFNNINELINSYLKVNIFNTEFFLKITGIFEGASIPSKYDNYDNKTSVDDWDTKKISSFNYFINDTNNKTFLVNDNFYNYVIATSNHKQRFVGDNYKYFKQANGFRITYNDYSSYYNYYNLDTDIKLPAREINPNGDVYVPIDLLTFNLSSDGNKIERDFWPAELRANLISLYEKYYTIYHNYKVELADSKHTTEEQTSFHQEFDKFNQILLKIAILEFKDKTPEIEERLNELYNSPDYSIDYNKQNKYYEYLNNIEYDDQLYRYQNIYNSIDSITNYGDYFSILNQLPYYSIPSYDVEIFLDAFAFYLSNKNINLDVLIEINGDYPISLNKTIKGFYYKEDDDGGYGIYIKENDESYFKPSSYYVYDTKYKLEESDSYYMQVFIPLNSANNIFNEIDYTNTDDSISTTNNTLYRSASSIISFVDTLKKVFFYIGLVLAVFAAMLLFNFISASISSKTHEIGVLRAVGARGNDVFKIFFSESLFIAMLSYILALIAAFIIVLFLNRYISQELEISLKLLTFGFLSIGSMLAIALTVAVIGTFIPVFLIARKKPVDSLRSL